jgi:hypothetical protein
MVYKCSDVIRNKMSNSHKGKIFSEEHRKNISKARKGIKFSKEHIKNMSKARVGKKLSEETKIKISESEKGSKHYNWQGGKIIDRDGYVLIHSPTHPFRKSNNYVYEHRLIMEKHLGRFLNLSEIVHHINDKKDDNRIENLHIINRSQHITMHYSKIYSFRKDKRR